MPLSARFPGRDLQRGVEFPQYGLVHRVGSTLQGRPMDAWERRGDPAWGWAEPTGRRYAYSGGDSPSHVDTAGLRVHGHKPSAHPHPYSYHTPPSHRVFLRDYDRLEATRGGGGPSMLTSPSSKFVRGHNASRSRSTAFLDLASREHARFLARTDATRSSPSHRQHTRQATPATETYEHVTAPHEATLDTTFENLAVDEPASVATAPATSAAPPKQSRYLRELDRRIILSRLAAGEKQSVLAKEYNVSRSTICNLFRQRDVVLARKHENPMARHPKKTRKPVAFQATASASPHVRIPTQEVDLCGTPVVHIQSRAITLLQQTLTDGRTLHDEFKRCSSRLMRLLLEESLAVVASRSRSSRPRVCGALSMEDPGRAMLDTFRQLEPDAPTALLGDGVASQAASLDASDLLLLDVVAASGRAVCAAIDSLLARGAQPERVSLVAIFVAADVVTQLQRTHPRVQILTTAVVGAEPPTLTSADPTLRGSATSAPTSAAVGAFLDRFQSATWNGSQVLWTAC